MTEPTIFTRIINGEIPSHKIYEDDKVIAILDIHPLSEGHTLVISKQQIDHIWDLDDENYQYLWSVVKKIGAHVKDVIQPTRVGVVVEGFGVPHVHIQLIPIYKIGDLGKPQDFDSKVDHQSLAAIADKLRM
jgi:histidine triad (HIT) family protein